MKEIEHNWQWHPTLFSFCQGKKDAGYAAKIRAGGQHQKISSSNHTSVSTNTSDMCGASKLWWTRSSGQLPQSTSPEHPGRYSFWVRWSVTSFTEKLIGETWCSLRSQEQRKSGDKCATLAKRDFLSSSRSWQVPPSAANYTVGNVPSQEPVCGVTNRKISCKNQRKIRDFLTNRLNFW